MLAWKTVEQIATMFEDAHRLASTALGPLDRQDAGELRSQRIRLLDFQRTVLRCCDQLEEHFASDPQAQEIALVVNDRLLDFYRGFTPELDALWSAESELQGTITPPRPPPRPDVHELDASPLPRL